MRGFVAGVSRKRTRAGRGGAVWLAQFLGLVDRSCHFSVVHWMKPAFEGQGEFVVSADGALGREFSVVWV